MADLTLSTELQGSAIKFRKTLLQLPSIGIQDAVQHMTPRPGVIHKETVSDLTGSMELRPYNGDKNAGKNIGINSRTLETFLGSCVEEFDPNSLRSTIYGQLLASGGVIQNSQINKGILMKIMKSVMEKLNTSLCSATRNATGKTTATLFNGFDTITQAEITAAKISAALKNYTEVAKITDDNAYDIINGIYTSASDDLQSTKTKLFVPRSVYNSYNKDYQQTVGSTLYNKEFKKVFVEGSGDLCELAPIIAKKNSSFLHLTTKSNMLYGFGNGLDSQEQIRVRECDNPFLMQFVLALFFGVEFESISDKRLLVVKVASE